MTSGKLQIVYEHGEPDAVLTVEICGDEHGPVLVMHDSVSDWTLTLAPRKARQLRDLINTILE